MAVQLDGLLTSSNSWPSCNCCQVTCNNAANTEAKSKVLRVICLVWQGDRSHVDSVETPHLSLFPLFPFNPSCCSPALHFNSFNLLARKQSVIPKRYTWWNMLLGLVDKLESFRDLLLYAPVKYQLNLPFILFWTIYLSIFTLDSFENMFVLFVYLNVFTQAFCDRGNMGRTSLTQDDTHCQVLTLRSDWIFPKSLPFLFI